jgi:hypothetical protein
MDISGIKASEWVKEDPDWAYGVRKVPQTPISLYFVIPIWVVILPLGLLALYGLFSISFSLRTLLIATMLVAVVLGLVVWCLR